MTATAASLATIAPTRTLILCDLPLRLSVWTSFAAILRYALEQIEVKDTTVAVHEYRRSVRRARSLLRLVRPSLERDTWRELDTILRDQVRRTSALRDADVLAATLDALPADLQSAHAEAFILSQERLAAPPAGDAPDAREVLRGTASALLLAVSLLGVELPRGFDVEALDEGLRASYRAAAKALDQAVETRDSDDVHTLRKRVKELRYQLEALSAQHKEWRAEQERARFAALASELGEATDLFVLRAAILGHEAPVAGQEAFVSAIDAHTAAKVDAALASAASALDQHARRWVKGLREAAPLDGDLNI